MALIEIGPLMALLHRRPGKSVVRSMIGVVAPGWISALLLFFCGKANVGEAQMLAMLCLLLAACLVVSVRSRDVARRQLVEWKFRTLAAEPNLWSSIARKSSNEPASTSLGLPPHCYETTAT